MKREILFIGKRVDNGGWIQGSLLLPTTDKTKTIIIAWNGTRFEVDPETIGQFTGLTDKNGVKIFEGDICTFKACSNKYKKKVVEYYKYGFFVGDYSVGDNCEVIGNIYDNPELLS